MPLPFSSRRSARLKQALAQKRVATSTLEHYRQRKESLKQSLQHQIEKVEAELDIVGQKSIPFARSARAITAKSYTLGDATYRELLQSEITLQNLLLLSIRLRSKRDLAQVNYKYTVGERLYE